MKTHPAHSQNLRTIAKSAYRGRVICLKMKCNTKNFACNRLVAANTLAPADALNGLLAWVENECGRVTQRDAFCRNGDGRLLVMSRSYSFRFSSSLVFTTLRSPSPARHLGTSRASPGMQQCNRGTHSNQ
jgi:hypothetical protein